MPRSNSFKTLFWCSLYNFYSFNFKVKLFENTQTIKYDGDVKKLLFHEYR